MLKLSNLLMAVMMAVIISSILGVLIGGPILSASRSPSPATPYSPPTGDNIAAAQALYEVNCAVCHGDDREGKPGLGLPLTPESLAAKSDEEIKATITNGKTGTVMPAWGGTLSAEDIDKLLQLLKYTPVQ